MAVYQLRREADVVGHDHPGAAFIVSEVRHFGKDDLEAARCQQCVPEGEILVHIQASWQTDGQSGGRHGLFGLAEKQAVLLFVYVCGAFAPLAVGKHPFAAVAAVIALPAGEVVARHQAPVVTPLAVQQFRRVLHLCQYAVQCHGSMGCLPAYKAQP